MQCLKSILAQTFSNLLYIKLIWEWFHFATNPGCHYHRKDGTYLVERWLKGKHVLLPTPSAFRPHFLQTPLQAVDWKYFNYLIIIIIIIIIIILLVLRARLHPERRLWCTEGDSDARKVTLMHGRWLWCTESASHMFRPDPTKFGWNSKWHKMAASFFEQSTY